MLCVGGCVPKYKAGIKELHRGLNIFVDHLHPLIDN